MALINELKKIGLSEKEAKVYLALLELGEDTVQNIAAKSGVNRATTYVVLEKLASMGLSANYEKDKKTFFVASEPEALESIFEIQKKEIEEKKKNFQLILSQIMAISNKDKAKPVIKFFEGKEGIVAAMKEFYAYQKKGGIVHLIYPRMLLDKLMPLKDRQALRENRLKKKIRTRVLYTNTEIIPSTADGERRRIDADKFPVSCDIEIYDEAVLIVSLEKQLSAVLIRDKQIAQTLTSLFELAWITAKKF